MKDSMLSENVIMGESTRKFLKRNLEKQCTDIKMFNCQRKVIVYPNSLNIQQIIEKNIQLSETKVIKTEVSKMHDSLPWPLKLKIYIQRNSKSMSH